MPGLVLLIIKKTITLFALVEPVAMTPVFLTAVRGFAISDKHRYARDIAIAVTVSLLAAALLGTAILDLLGISISAMQVGGGVIMLLLAIAMVLGKESTFKGMPESGEPLTASVVPLAIPLLAGPAAFSYVISGSVWSTYIGVITTLVPIFIVGSACWALYHIASRTDHTANKTTLDLVERIGGFLLTAMSVELMAAGIKGLFPGLGT